MDLICENCGESVAGERPRDNHYECWYCLNCGRSWDEDFVHSEGDKKWRKDNE